MCVRVRLRPMELTTGAVYETFPDADKYLILEDNTIQVYKKDRQGRLRVIGHVHKERWEAVAMHDDVLVTNEHV